jgi:zinc protease
MPNSGHTTGELEKEILSELENLKTEGVTGEELVSAKTRLKVGIIRGLNSRQGLIMQLLNSEVIHGSWQKVFDELKDIEAVTVDDLKELTKKYFIEKNRIVIRLEKKKKEGKK